jgi:hypothetical protein
MVHRKSALTLASAMATLDGSRWFGTRRQQADGADAHSCRAVLLFAQRPPVEAAAEFRTAIRLSPDLAPAELEFVRSACQN